MPTEAPLVGDAAEDLPDAGSRGRNGTSRQIDLPVHDRPSS